MNSANLRMILQITKALADRQRIRILALLQGKELCVCQIIAVLELAPSTISKHLAILASAGLVEHRKEGRWAFYRLPGSSADAAPRSALQWLGRSLRGEDEIEKDARKLETVLGCGLEVLCRQQRKS